MFNANEILQLINAGFTKDEVLALASTQRTGETPTNPIAPTVQPEAEPQTLPPSLTNNEPTAPVAQVAAPVMTDAQVEKLAQLINVNSATIDIPPTRTVDDVLAERFTNLILGK